MRADRPLGRQLDQLTQLGSRPTSDSRVGAHHVGGRRRRVYLDDVNSVGNRSRSGNQGMRDVSTLPDFGKPLQISRFVVTTGAWGGAF